MGLFTPKWLKVKLEDDILFEKYLNQQGFTISKKVFQYPNIYVDNDNKQFAFSDRKKIFKYSDLLDISRDERTVISTTGGKGSTGKAIVGGLAFGTAGAVVGASMKKEPVQKSLRRSDIYVKLNDLDRPQLTFHFFDGRQQYTDGKPVLTEQKIDEVEGTLAYIKANS